MTTPHAQPSSALQSSAERTGDDVQGFPYPGETRPSKTSDTEYGPPQDTLASDPGVQSVPGGFPDPHPANTQTAASSSSTQVSGPDIEDAGTRSAVGEAAKPQVSAPAYRDKGTQATSAGARAPHAQDTLSGVGTESHNAQDVPSPTPSTTTALPKHTDTGGTTATTGARVGEAFGKGVKDVVYGIHGAGEVIRGNLGQAVDEAFGHTAGVEKHQKIIQQGMEQMRRTRGASPTPAESKSV